MAINVGSAIAYLELDTSQFRESIKGAGSELEVFANGDRVGITTIGESIDVVVSSSQELELSFQDTAVSMSNMEVSIASSIMELKICISEFRLSIIETIEVLKVFADEILLVKLVKGLNAVGSALASVKFTELYDQILKVSTSISSLSSEATKVTSLGVAFNSLSITIENVSKITRDLGMSFTELKSKIDPVVAVVEQLKNKTMELIVQQKESVVQINFTRDAMTALKQSIEQCLGSFNQLSISLKRCNDETKELAQTLKDNLKVALDAVKDSSQNVSIKISGELASSIGKASDSAKDLGENLKESAEKGKESTGMFSSISKALEPFISKVKEIISFVEEWIGKFKKLIEILNTIKDFASKFEKLSGLVTILEKIIATIEKIISFIEKLIGIVNKVIGAFESLEAAAGVFAEIAAAIGPEVAIIIAIIAAIGLIVYEVIKHWDELKIFFNGFCDYVKGAFNNFFKWLGDAWTATWDGFGDFASNIGACIIDGLLGGLEKGWNKIKEKVSFLGNGIRKLWEEIFGIQSPSKVFAKYGSYMGEGLIVGIDNQDANITSKFTTLGNKIKDLGNVKPEFAGLNNMALSGAYGSTSGFGLSNSKQLNFTPNITMHISVADTGAKGTAQVASELKTMAQNAIKNSMVDEFMADALRL